MSTSDLYILNGKSVTHWAEFRNGWGSAPVVWDYLAEKYLTGNFTDYMRRDYIGFERKCRLVWALNGDDRLTEDERFALLLTFDRAFVPRDRLRGAADLCADFARRTSHIEGVNHWAAIGKSLEAMSTARLGRHARGACLSCTSVNDEWLNNKEWPKDAWPIFADHDRAKEASDAG